MRGANADIPVFLINAGICRKKAKSSFIARQ